MRKVVRVNVQVSRKGVHCDMSCRWLEPDKHDHVLVCTLFGELITKMERCLECKLGEVK